MINNQCDHRESALVSSVLSIAWLMVVAAIGCIGSTTDAGAADDRSRKAVGDAQTLQAADVTRLLSNGSEFRETSPFVGTSARRREFFRNGGHYLGCSDRAEIEGRYFTRANRLCVQVGANPPACRIIADRGAGAFEQRLIGRDGKVGPPLAVKIAPIPPKSDCLAPEMSQ